MIPYIVINGVDSRTVNGLLIQSLPPITKPKIRTEKNEIDGRDGDLIDKLGFEAYDKEFTIGLYGQYDVDEVIEYLNAEGKIIFSNEPDKYYEFACYDEIDFDKLLRFRTAKVKYHVQPFKYPADEQPVTYLNDAEGGIFNTIFFKRVKNLGNYESTPIFEIKGQNDINIYINNKKVLKCALGASETTIVIDTETMNAYKDSVDSGVYLNRSCQGDYNDLKLKAGANEIRITGEIVSLKLSKISRWI